MLFCAYQAVRLRNVADARRKVIFVTLQLSDQLVWGAHRLLLFFLGFIMLNSSVSHSLLESIWVYVCQVDDLNVGLISLSGLLWLLHRGDKDCRSFRPDSSVNDNVKIIDENQIFNDYFAVVWCLALTSLITISSWSHNLGDFGAL